MNTITLIAAAVLNSLWQVAILTFLVWLALKLLAGRVNAATRHVIWWIALAALLIVPWVHRTAPPTPAVQTARPQTTARALPIPVAPPLAAAREPVPVTVTKTRTAVWPWMILAVWAAVFASRSTAMVRSYLHLRTVKRRATAWEHPLPGLTRSSRLLISSDVASPIAVGFLRPAVILPEKLRGQLTSGEMNCVLLHEAAHLARRDDWTNLAARALGAVIALHPVAWWILREIEREREIACDDWVVAHTGMAYSYAESLARVVALRLQPADSLLAAGIFTRRSQTVARIEMLLRHGREFSTVAARVPLGVAALALAALGIAGALVPHWIVFAQRLEFELASVKQNTTNGNVDGWPRRSGDLVTMHNTQVYSMIYYAYHLHGRYQMVGYPDLPDPWRWWDIDARIGRDATEVELRLMMQSLLEDRFKLKAHRETREIPEYELTVGKGKLKLSPGSEEPMNITIEDRHYTQPKGTCGGSMWNDGTHLVCHAATIEQIVAQASGFLQAPVADRTELTGTYDVHIHFVDDRQRMKNPDLADEPSIAQAFQEELGLKLEKGKGPVEVLVIDHMEKASPNQ